MLGAAGADGPPLDVTVGRVLLPLVLVGGAVATVHVAVRSRLALAGTVAALLVVLVVLDRVATAPVVTTTPAVAAVVGVVLLLAEAGWQTWTAVRRPEPVVVVAPGSDPRDERRRNVRAGIALAWLLPGHGRGRRGVLRARAHAHAVTHRTSTGQRPCHPGFAAYVSR